MICIIDFFPRAREIKPDGADIVEVLQCYSPSEIREHIKRSVESGNSNRPNNSDIVSGNGNIGVNRDIKRSAENEDRNGNTKRNDGNVGSDKKNGLRDNQRRVEENQTDADIDVRRGADDYPFTVLGIGDDNQAYFLDHTGRMMAYKLSSLSDMKLIDLAGLEFWKYRNGGHPDKKQWLELIDELMHVSKTTDFDIDRLRGRGAWRTKSGEICYFDGRTVTGKPDSNWVFVRRPERKIGLCQPECCYEVRSEIRNICNQFTFVNEWDIIRSLAWATLAPFGGALIWRPALMMNGESGSGKSTILMRLINEISSAQFFDGKETTEPGIRETLGLDSYGVTIDEAEPGNEKRDRERFARILSMVRTASTDNSPKTAKGTGGHGAITYRMRSMVCLASINAAVGTVAEDNRIIRTNLEERKNLDSFFQAIKRLDALLTHQNSNGIRSFVWNHLQQIIETGKILEYLIQREGKKTARFAAGESILLSAYMHTWEQWSKESLISESFLNDYQQRFYEHQTFEEDRNETNELVERILDEVITVDDLKEKHSIRDVLTKMKIYNDKQNGKLLPVEINVPTVQMYEWYRRSIEQCGITIHIPTGGIFIAQNNHVIMKIIEVGKGYHRQLMRHKKIIRHQDTINPLYKIDGAPKRGVVIGGMLEY